MKLKKFLGLLLSSSVLLSSCQVFSNPNPDSSVENYTKNTFKPLSNNEKINSENKIINSNNKFSLDVFRQMYKEDKSKNIFMSPLSIFFAFSMIMNAADKETLDEFKKVFHTDDINLFNKENNLLIRDLVNKDKNVELDISNSIWGQKNIKFSDDFIKLNTDFYKAKYEALDFSDKKSVDTINNWISQSTRKKIDKMIDNIDSDVIMILINAIYFKAQWENKFDKELTESKDFNVSEDKKQKVSMMKISDKFPYYSNDKLQGVGLPYGKGDFIFYAFLPSENSSLEEMIKDFDMNIFKSFNSKQGKIELPRFKSEYKKELPDTLKALGLNKAFDSELADFNKLTKDKLKAFISKASHKAVIEVNEEGTEAAAVTDVQVSVTSAPIMDKPFEFVANKPFLYFIKEKNTDSIVFMGVLNNP